MGFIKFLRAQDDKDLHLLSENMALDLTPEIIGKIKNLSEPEDESTKSIVAHLKKIIGKVDEVLIIGDGENTGEED